MIPTVTAAQRQALDSDGFFVLPDVFTAAEMDELAEHLEVHHQRGKDWARREAGKKDSISKVDEVTFTCLIAEHDPWLRAFATRPEFVALCNQLIGPDTDLYWNQTVFKEPEGKKIFPWHQDDGYAEVDPAPYLTCWLAVNDATAENGCISALPGRWKNGLIPHTPSPEGLVCHPSDHPDQGVMVPVKKGSLAVFWSLTPHKSGVNRSNGIRKAYILQYAKAGTKLVKTGEVINDRITVSRDGRSTNGAMPEKLLASFVG